MVGFFTDGLTYNYMKMKVMRDNPNTLQEAITVATNEQNLRNLRTCRSGNHYQRDNNHMNAGPKPMDVEHVYPALRCYHCHSKGHKIKDCRMRHRQIDGVNISTQQQVSPSVVAGLGGLVGCAVRLENRRSRVQPPPRSATFFHGD